MAIEVSCGKCGKAYRVREDRAGTKIRCKECQSVISVPVVEYEGDEDEYGFADASSWDEPEPRALPRRSQPGVTKAATSAAAFTIRKLFGVLALLVAGLMCLGIGFQLMNGNFRALGGFVLVAAVGGVGLKWLRT